MDGQKLHDTRRMIKEAAWSRLDTLLTILDTQIKSNPTLGAKDGNALKDWLEIWEL
jgi:hypothetical protein